MKRWDEIILDSFEWGIDAIQKPAERGRDYYYQAQELIEEQYERERAQAAAESRDLMVLGIIGATGLGVVALAMNRNGGRRR